MNPFLNTPDAPIIQTAQSGVSAITAGGDTMGWISGDISGLAASANVSVIFDLGPLWRRISLVAASFYVLSPSSGLTGVTFASGMTPAWDTNERRLAPAGATNGSIIYATMVSSSIWFEYFVKPTGRYLIINMSNADSANAVGAGSNIQIITYPS